MTTKTLVLYVFHQYNNLVERFIDKCIFYDENVDFVFISNNKDIKYVVPVYVKKIFRDNDGCDFGGWSEALLKNNFYTNYDNFIFVNSSVIGPFIPSYYKGKWTDIYLSQLTDNIKLFGSSINLCFWGFEQNRTPHVQSYIFAMKKTTLEYLIECEIFSMKNHYNTIVDTIHHKEVFMSRKIIEKGWNIGSFLKCYKDIDFTFKNKNFADYNIPIYGEDLIFEKFHNKLWNEYELVFIKGNRDIILSDYTLL